MTRRGYADATAARLVQGPGHFDVLVMGNFLGAILSEGAISVRPDGTVAEGTTTAGRAVAQEIR